MFIRRGMVIKVRGAVKVIKFTTPKNDEKTTIMGTMMLMAIVKYQDKP